MNENINYDIELTEEELEETNGGGLLTLGIIGVGTLLGYLAGRPTCIYPVRRR